MERIAMSKDHIRTTLALLAGFLALAVGVLDTPAQGATNISLKLRFFDENGVELNYSALATRMTNGQGVTALSSGTVDLATLKTLTLNTSVDSAGAWLTPFENLEAYPRQGLMVHWNTVNTGYSTFLLDNQGKGFSESATLIFNEQLAYDARRQFNEALARKPDYLPSSRFAQFQQDIDGCFAQLAAAATDSLKGSAGQRCVDLLAQAMALMLREYGIQQARFRGDDALWGVTLTPLGTTADYPKIDDLADLFAPQHRWVRLIMAETTGTSFEQVRQALNYASGKGVHTLGQLFDSHIQQSLTLDQFKAGVDAALTYPDFDKFTAWEVGNEVNGGWLGSGMTQKIDYAAARVKQLYPAKKVCLTFYWYAMQDTLETSLFNWIETNITETIRNTIDCVALSIYTDQQPLGFSWDLVMSKLAEIFPGKSVLVGELGFVDPTVARFYKEGPLDLTLDAGGELYIENRYPASFATPNSFGGNFWWYFDQEMVGKTGLWHKLRSIYCMVYPKLCPEFQEIALIEPVASAGQDSTVLTGASVTLDGSASHDPTPGQAQPLSYQWTQTAGPPVNLSPGPHAAKPSFTAPSVTGDTALSFQLVVTNAYGNASRNPAVVKVTVQPKTTPPTSDPGPSGTTPPTSNPGSGGTTPPASAPGTGGSAQPGTPPAPVTSPSPPDPGAKLSPSANVTEGVKAPVNTLPNRLDCSQAVPSRIRLWPANRRLIPVTIQGITGPNSYRLAVTGVTSDEPVKDKAAKDTTRPDAKLRKAKATKNTPYPADRLLLRAERQVRRKSGAGSGNGRVYVIGFSASDGTQSCTGSVRISVPLQKDAVAVDDGQKYDATRAQ
jgi:hypothetical protein